MNVRKRKIEYNRSGQRTAYNYELDQFNISISHKGPRDDCVIFDTPLCRVPANRLEEIVQAYRLICKERP